MNLLIHDIAAAIEREADDHAARRARAAGPADPLVPWQEPADDAQLDAGDASAEGGREQR